MTIRVWDYLAEYAAEREDILDAVDTVFRSGRLILGESVRRFESAFAEYCGVRSGIGVDNGTNALFLTLKALGIGAGDEVITVANTAVPTISAIVAAGATPRFVDIDPATFLMDASLLDAAVTPRTRCIVPVHLFGQCADMEAVNAVAARHDIVVVEDCAQAHGATQRGRRAGSMSRAAVYSFYPTKVLGAYGDGGMVVTNEEALEHALRRLRYYGMEEKYYAVEDGYNARLDEVHAEILARKLTRIDQYISRRRELAARYDKLLDPRIARPSVLPGNDHVFYLYVVRHPARTRILAELLERDIELNVSYRWPIHLMPAYAHLGYHEGDLPATESAAREIFSLPMYPRFPETDQQRVCDALGEILAQLS